MAENFSVSKVFPRIVCIIRFYEGTITFSTEESNYFPVTLSHKLLLLCTELHLMLRYI